MNYSNPRMQLSSEIAKIANWLNVSIRTIDFHRIRVELGLSQSAFKHARGTAVINTSCLNLAKREGNQAEACNIHNCYVSPNGFLARRKGDPKPKVRTDRPIATYEQVLKIVESLLGNRK